MVADVRVEEREAGGAGARPVEIREQLNLNNQVDFSSHSVKSVVHWQPAREYCATLQQEQGSGVGVRSRGQEQ